MSQPESPNPQTPPQTPPPGWVPVGWQPVYFQPPPPPPPPKKRRWIGKLAWFLCKWSLVAGIWGSFIIMLFAAWCAYDLPDISKVNELKRRSSVTLLAANGSIINSYGDLYGDNLRLQDMPPHLIQAVIATEDRRFFNHFGVDLLGLARAAFVNFRAGRTIQGGSTITQQLAKNLFLTPERSLHRKGQEMLLAIWMERQFSKDQILDIYLNRVYFGAGTFGVDAASRRYFGKSVRDIDLYEAAVLAALLKAPSRYNPLNNKDLTRERAAIVLANMVNAGFLDETAANNAISHPPETVAEKENRNVGQYFADWAIDQVSSFVNVEGQDLVVFTTLDPVMSVAAERHVAEIMQNEGQKLSASQAALVALSPNGAIRALIGGTDYRTSQFNRATQALRQPGSAFKAFVFLAGFNAGLTADSRFNDAPIQVGKWRPGNYEDKYYGDVTLREAFARSLNSVTVQIAEKVGRKRVIEEARKLGITANLPNHPSIALGAVETSLLEMTAAYSTFANLGRGVFPYGIEKIATRDGHVLYERSGSGLGQIVPTSSLISMLQAMSAVIDYGTGKKAKLDFWPAAGKTGTTQSYRDAWFIGLTADLVTGVWVGNDDEKAMDKVTGGSLPVRIWHDFMTEALAGRTPRPIPLPGGGGAGVAAPLSADNVNGNAAGAPANPSPPASSEEASGLEKLLDSILSNTTPAAPAKEKPNK